MRRRRGQPARACEQTRSVQRQHCRMAGERPARHRRRHRTATAATRLSRRLTASCRNMCTKSARNLRPSAPSCAWNLSPANASKWIGDTSARSITPATQRKLYAFALVDAHSRMLYVEFTHSQSFETFARCHIHAFTALGGVAREIAYDFVPGNKIVIYVARRVMWPRRAEFLPVRSRLWIGGT